LLVSLFARVVYAMFNVFDKMFSQKEQDILPKIIFLIIFFSSV
jgi:hypothetical protein